jgi:hypothetical protein
MQYRIGIVAGVVLSLCILSTGCGNSTNPTASLTTIDFNGVNSASSKSAKGLSLSLSLDSTTYQPGQQVTIVIDEINTLSKTNNVSASNKWPSNNLALDIPNESTMFPFGVAFFRGDYTLLNYSTGTPLVIFNPSELYIGTPVVGPTSYSFHPSSDIVNVEGPQYSANIARQISSTITLRGYWPNHNYGAQIIQFDPGVYTVVGGDEWGSLVVLHFTVSQ